MLVITTAIQAMVSMAALTPPVLAPLIARELDRPAALVVSLLTSVLYFGAIVSSLLSGAGLKRFGAIRVSQASLLLCALGLGLVSGASWPALLVGALTVGLGYGAVTPASSH